MAGIIRLAAARDADALAKIYAPYVENTTFSFETQAPSSMEFARRITKTLPSFPYLVYELNGEVLGYAYAHRHAERAAYAWAAEASIYLAPKAQGIGAARRLYTVLFDMLRAMNYVHLYCLVTHPNPRSEAFHEKMGFTRVATFPGIAFKKGRWIDLGYYHLSLCPLPEKPAPTLLFGQLEPSLVRSLLWKNV